jgi:NAD(P)-dependent dehydrogenase (short-subunit alcohol dehydrogenase family)
MWFRAGQLLNLTPDSIIQVGRIARRSTERVAVNVAQRVAVVTGGGAGIGSALVARLAREGARVVVADLDADSARAVSERVNAEHPGSTVSAGGDVSDTEQIQQLVDLAESTFGPVDLYFANAGIAGALGIEASEQDWDRSIDVNLRAHIRAATLLVPRWLERGEGYFVSTASAAGLLTQIGSATYAVTKHAAVAFAEWLSVTYGDRGVRVSCLCPMGVNTKLLSLGEDSDDALGRAATRAVTSAGDVLEPAEVADVVLAAIEDEHFLILPHKDVLEMYRHKGSDYDRWLRGMRRHQSSLLAQA